MATKRRPINRARRRKITPDAVEAYLAGDYHRQHAALGLMPWEGSPLPVEVHGLGVDQGEPPAFIARVPHRLADYRRAQELQRELEAAL